MKGSVKSFPFSLNIVKIQDWRKEKMILKENQKVNIVTRAIIIRDNHLLITKWKDSFSFLIGGRVDFGEPLEKSVLREVFEETKMKGKIKKLIYFNENIFRFKEIDHHEFGWYYLVEIEDWEVEINDVIQNPDADQLTIQFVPFDRLGEFELYPSFLVDFLPKDAADQFSNAPRHIYSNDLMSPKQIIEMNKTC